MDKKYLSLEVLKLMCISTPFYGSERIFSSQNPKRGDPEEIQNNKVVCVMSCGTCMLQLDEAEISATASWYV